MYFCMMYVIGWPSRWVFFQTKCLISSRLLLTYMPTPLLEFSPGLTIHMFSLKASYPVYLKVSLNYPNPGSEGSFTWKVKGIIENGSFPSRAMQLRILQNNAFLLERWKLSWRWLCIRTLLRSEYSSPGGEPGSRRWQSRYIRESFLPWDDTVFCIISLYSSGNNWLISLPSPSSWGSPLRFTQKSRAASSLVTGLVEQLREALISLMRANTSSFLLQVQNKLIRSRHLSSVTCHHVFALIYVLSMAWLLPFPTYILYQTQSFFCYRCMRCLFPSRIKFTQSMYFFYFSSSVTWASLKLYILFYYKYVFYFGLSISCFYDISLRVVTTCTFSTLSDGLRSSAWSYLQSTPIDQVLRWYSQNWSYYFSSRRTCSYSCFRCLQNQRPPLDELSFSSLFCLFFVKLLSEVCFMESWWLGLGYNMFLLIRMKSWLGGGDTSQYNDMALALLGSYARYAGIYLPRATLYFSGVLNLHQEADFLAQLLATAQKVLLMDQALESSRTKDFLQRERQSSI